MSYFSVEILTPSAVIGMELPADSLLIPTVKGMINVLPEHTHIVAKLDTGILSIIKGKEKHHYSISTGICKVLHKKITILAHTVEKSEEIDLERAKKAFAKSIDKINGKETLTDDDLIKYRRKYDRAMMRIKIAALIKK